MVKAASRPRRPSFCAILIAFTACASIRAEDAAQQLALVFQQSAGMLSLPNEPAAACYGGADIIYVTNPALSQITVITSRGESVRVFGKPGDGAAEFRRPTGLAFAAERLYVADTGNGRVQVFSSSGAFLSTIGRRGTRPGELRAPSGVAVAAHRVAVADTGNHRVQVFDLDGRVLFVAGGHGSDTGQLIAPADVALDGEGQLYVADTGNDRIVKFDAHGAHVASWGARGTAPGFFQRPTGIRAHAGAIYVVDSANHRVQVFDVNGAHLGAWGVHSIRPRDGDGRLHYPERVDFDPVGARALVCEPFENRLQVFRAPAVDAPPPPLSVPGGPVELSHFGPTVSVRGSLLALVEFEAASVSIYDLRRAAPILIHNIGTHDRKLGGFLEPAGVLLDNQRRIVVCEPLQRRLQIFQHEFDPQGDTRYVPDLTRLVRSVDFAARRAHDPKLAELDVIEPWCARRGADENLYVLDRLQGVVVVFAPDFSCLRYFGGREQAQSRLNLPSDFAFSADNNTIYIADTGNSRVQLHALGGKPMYSFRDASDGELVEPTGLAIGADGSLYVTDRATHRLLQFRQDGQHLRSWGAMATANERLSAGAFYKPAGVALLVNGDLAVVDHGNHRCQVLGPNGEFRFAFGARLYVAPTLTKPALPGGQ
ncbi:MAG: hypothetical protein ACKVX7_18315 [Planctomycetota bacterium]